MIEEMIMMMMMKDYSLVRDTQFTLFCKLLYLPSNGKEESMLMASLALLSCEDVKLTSSPLSPREAEREAEREAMV